MVQKFLQKFVRRVRHQSIGFTLIEVMVVIGIISALSSLSMPAYRTYQVRNDMNIASEQIIQGMARAKLLSQTGENDSEWGFYAPDGTLYQGPSYQTRDPEKDEMYPMPSSITFEGPVVEVSYSRLDGNPNQTGSIVLTALDGKKREISVEIEVQPQTIASNVTDKVTICHKPGTPAEKTMTIPDNAVPGHVGHGDTIGACPAGSSSSSSSSSTSASSISSSFSSSSFSSSSQGGGSWGQTCNDRVFVESNGNINTLSVVNMTVKGIASQITYGAGGPKIPVTVFYSKNGGSKFYSLFNGALLASGLTQTITGIAADSDVVIRFKGYYKKNGWLTFNATYDSNKSNGHILVLRDGDQIPSYMPFGNQQSLKTLLADYVGEDGKIDIGTYEIILLAEIGASVAKSPSADFQDGVVLLTFTQDAGACGSSNSSSSSSSISSGGSMAICHQPGSPAQQTMIIPSSAWNGHQVHGDYQGPC